MKGGKIIRAYDSIKAGNDLKNKLLENAELITEKASDAASDKGKKSVIRMKNGGKNSFTGLVTAAALILAFILIVPEIGTVPGGSHEDTVFTEATDTDNFREAEPSPVPAEGADVVLKIKDAEGNLLKNIRVDYIPSIMTVKEGGFSSVSVICDMDNIDKGGTIPIVYGGETHLRIKYGSYIFVVSDALPNDTLTFANENGQVTQMFAGGSVDRWYNSYIDVKEGMTEIELAIPFSTELPSVRENIRLLDSEGAPITDCTVILVPDSGELEYGYTDIYGGYVLPPTDEKGNTVWKRPIEGEYTLTAYRERLHLADVPPSRPVSFIDGGKYTVAPPSPSEEKNIKVFYSTEKISDNERNMNMKKSAILTAALSLGLTLTPAAPSVYGVQPSYVSEAEETAGCFTEAKRFTEQEKGIIQLITEDGTGYYQSYDSSKGLLIYSADSDGKIKNRFTVKNYTGPEGYSLTVSECDVRRYGEYLYLCCTARPAEYFGSTERFVIKLDMELNETDRFDVPVCRQFFTDGERLIYMKRSDKIFVSDLDGSNRKVIYKAGGKDGVGWINNIEFIDGYIGFDGGRQGGGNGKYMGYINVRTGKSEAFFKEELMNIVQENNRLIWSVDPFLDETSSTGTLKRRSHGTFWIFDGKTLTELETKISTEALYFDDSGNIITARDLGNGNGTDIKLYKDGTVKDTFHTDLSAAALKAADGRIIISSRVYAPDADLSWHKVEPGTNPSAVIKPAEYTVTTEFIDYSAE